MRTTSDSNGSQEIERTANKSIAAETNNQQVRHQRASVLILIVIVGFFVAVCYIYARGVYLNEPYPSNTFLFVPTARFTDFTEVVREGGSLRPYLKYESAQYPLLVIAAYLFSLLPRVYSYWVYVMLWAGAFVGLAFAFLRVGTWYERALAVFGLIFLSYPFLITIDRGNFEGLVFVLVMAFGYFFVKRKYWIAAAFLAMAAAMKLLPILLVLLFLRERKYRAVALSVLLTGALMLVSLKAFHGGVRANLDYIIHGSNLLANTTFGSFTSIDKNLVQRGVSIFTLIKIVLIETGSHVSTAPDNFLIIYVAVAGLAGVLMCAYAVFVERTLWKRVAILVFAMIMLPSISADYKLLYVFFPAFLFIGSTEERSRLEPVYLALFGLLLIPKSYYFFPTVLSDALPRVHDISISVAINIVDMVIFSLLIMLSGMLKWLRSRNTHTESARRISEVGTTDATQPPAP